MHIHLLCITNVLCPVTSHFYLLLNAAILKEEEGHVEKNWQFSGQASYRKQEILSCSIKRKKKKLE